MVVDSPVHRMPERTKIGRHHVILRVARIEHHVVELTDADDNGDASHVPSSKVPSSGGESTPSAAATTSGVDGLTEALLGLIAGFVVSLVAVAIYSGLTQRHVTANDFGANITSLAGLWVGLVGAAGSW